MNTLPIVITTRSSEDINKKMVDKKMKSKSRCFLSHLLVHHLLVPLVAPEPRWGLHDRYRQLHPDDGDAARLRVNSVTALHLKLGDFGIPKRHGV